MLLMDMRAVEETLSEERRGKGRGERKGGCGRVLCFFQIRQ